MKPRKIIKIRIRIIKYLREKKVETDIIKIKKKNIKKEADLMVKIVEVVLIRGIIKGEVELEAEKEEQEKVRKKKM